MMPRTTQCPHCNVVLNLPEGAEGRRLKCPHCAQRFFVSGGGGQARPASSGPSGSGPSASPNTKVPSSQGGGKRPGSSMILTESGENVVGVGDRDLRETFSPELLDADDPLPKRSSRPPSSSAHGIANAAGLLEDGAPPPKRRYIAESRSKPRRCPHCNAVVPVGMSLCRCGLDLDTGVRQEQVLDEILEEPLPESRRSNSPFGITITGGLALMISGLLTVFAFIKSADVKPDEPSIGPINQKIAYLAFAAVGGFAIYAAVQFLRLKSVKPLIVAFMLGGAIDSIALIIMPIVYAVNAPVGGTVEVSPDYGAVPVIQAAKDQLNTQLLFYGIAILLADAGAIVYLMSPAVRMYFDRPRQGPVPIV